MEKPDYKDSPDPQTCACSLWDCFVLSEFQCPQLNSHRSARMVRKGERLYSALQAVAECEFGECCHCVLASPE